MLDIGVRNSQAIELSSWYRAFICLLIFVDAWLGAIDGAQAAISPPNDAYVVNSAFNACDNATGRLLSRTDQMGYVTSFEYDALGRLTAGIDALNQRTEYDYDEVGAQTVQRDTKGRETTYTYDQLGRRATHPSGWAERIDEPIMSSAIWRREPISIVTPRLTIRTEICFPMACGITVGTEKTAW